MMQASNDEGPRHWDSARALWVDPARLARIDDMREYLHYFDDGAWGARLSVDRDREELRLLTQRLLESASLADQVQDQWAAYQAMIGEHLPAMLERGTELRNVLEDLERVAGSLDVVDASRPAARVAGAGAGANGSRSTSASAVHSAPDGAPAQLNPAAGPIGPATAGARGQRSVGMRLWPARPDLRIAAAVAGGVVVLSAALLAGALLLFDRAEPEGAVTTMTDSPVGPPAPGQSPASRPAGDAPSSVARERAALNERPAGERQGDRPADERQADQGPQDADSAGEPPTDARQPPAE